MRKPCHLGEASLNASSPTCVLSRVTECAQLLHAPLFERRFASQTAPIAAAPGRRKPHMRRGSTEGALQLQLQRENRRGSLIFDLSDSGEPQLSSNLLPQEYDTLRSHDDVDADLDLARDTLPAGSFTGSREISELDLETASQMVGSKSVPTAGLVRQQETEMRSATEVQHAVSRARERMPSDEWSEEARRTTHEVLVTFDAIAKPNEGAGEGEDDSTSLTVWRSPDDEASGTSGANGGGAVGGPDGYNPQRLVLDTTRGDTTNGRQHSTSPSASPRRRGAGTPGGRARQKTMWSGSVNSSGDEDRQHDLSDTDSDHDGGDSSGGTGVHGHHRLRSGSGATDDGAHRIGGSDDGAQRIGGGVKSSDGATGSLIMRRLAPVDNLAVDGDRTYISSADPRSDSGDYSESSLSNNNSSASNTGRIMEQHSSSTTMQRPGTAITGIGEESDPARLPVGDSSTSAPLSEQAATLPVVDSEGGMRGGNIPPGGNDSSLEPMLKMMSERCTKVQQEKHQLEERVAELEREKKEWEMLKARLISTLVDEGEE